jgi:hypothetical protein
MPRDAKKMCQRSAPMPSASQREGLGASTDGSGVECSVAGLLCIYISTQPRNAVVIPQERLGFDTSIASQISLQENTMTKILLTGK